MTPPITFDDAVDVLDADHKAVKKMFINYASLCEDGAPAAAKHALAQKICEALTIHAQLEEEIFYPEVRQAIDGDALIDEALDDHADAKETIALIEAMDAGDPEFDDTVKLLGKIIDSHVLEEREQIFLMARNAPLDLRGMTLPLLKRQQQLKKKAAVAAVKEAA